MKTGGADAAGIYVGGRGTISVTSANVATTGARPVGGDDPAVGVRIDWDETNRPTPIRMVILDDDGKEYVRVQGEVNVGRPAHLAPGSGQLASVAANVPLQVEAFGGYTLNVSAGPEGAEIRQTVPFRIVRTPAPPTPPQLRG